MLSIGARRAMVSLPHIGNGTARHVVQDHRQVHRFGDGLEVTVHAFLGRTVVVGDDLQRGVGADFPGVTRQRDRFGGRVAAGAGDDGDAAGHVVDGQLDQLAVLFRADGRRFAGGADDDDAVGAFGHVPVDQFAQAVLVETAILKHRRDDCYYAALNHNLWYVSENKNLIVADSPVLWFINRR